MAFGRWRLEAARWFHEKLRWHQFRRIWCLHPFVRKLKDFGSCANQGPHIAHYRRIYRWWPYGGLRAGFCRMVPRYRNMVGPSVEHGNNAAQAQSFRRQDPLDLLTAVACCGGPLETGGSELRLPTNSQVPRSGCVKTAWRGSFILALSGTSYPAPRPT